MSSEMTAYELALKYNLDQDLAYQLEVLDVIPTEEREDIIKVIVGEIRRYRRDQELWEGARDYGLPKQIKDVKRTTGKLHQEIIDIAVKYFRVISATMNEPDSNGDSPMTDLYGAESPLSPQASLEVIAHIERLYAMDIYKHIDESDHVHKRPNKEEIKKAIRTIFDHYKIEKVTDFMRDFLPHI